MREGIGSVFLYNMIFLFVIIVFGLLSATISYYKAFKVNERLLYSIDKFEGYNKWARNEMEQYLNSIGYTYEPSGPSACPTEKDGGELVTSPDATYLYCLYYFNDDRSTRTAEKNKVSNDKNPQPIYYNYAITTYIYVQLPIAGNFKIPVYTKGERIYNFGDNNYQLNRNKIGTEESGRV